MASIGVVANVQPSMVASDGCWVSEKVDQRLLAGSYAWKTLHDTGIVLAGGSDAPVEEPNPCLGIYDAIYRHAPRPKPVAGELGDSPNAADNAQNSAFRPEECLPVGVVVDAFTQGSAWAAGRDQQVGKIAEGYWADFVVVEGDTDVIGDPRKWLNVRFSQVWVGGVKRN